MFPISAIVYQSSQPTEDTIKQTQQLLDYIANQEEKVITYNASDMKLAAHSDASYLSKPQVRSRAGGKFFLVKQVNNTTEQWVSVKQSTHHKTRHDISDRSRARSTLHHGKRGSIHYNNSRGTGTQTTAHTTTNRQLNVRRSLQWESTSQNYKIHIHEFPLAQRQRMPATVHNILETG